jgi:tetratricopeptide (TPR) repeat protein
VLSNPDDLDLNFTYANLAMQLGKYDAAIAAYERMLIMAPDLDRVKLDMALAYARLGNYAQARTLFDEVLDKDPPEEVKANVNALIKQMDDAQKSHAFDMTVVGGINFDSNANASPSSNQVDLFGISVALQGTNLTQDDYHFFTAVTGNHHYTLPQQEGHRITNTLGAYKTKQHTLSSIDVTVLSARSAFAYNLPKHYGGGRLTPTVGFDDINLGGMNYQDTLYGQLGFDQPLSQAFSLSGAYRYEKRTFFNTPTNTTVSERTGRAQEQRLSAKVMVTPSDMVDIGIRMRQERTRRLRHDNRQQEVTLSHLHLFGQGVFLNTQGSIRQAHYKGVDTLVNPNTIRRDLERAITITLGKQLTPALTIAGAYQYRRVGSNLQNFAYTNQRTSLSLAYRF